ncbi:alpha-tubulin binding protein [Aureococcus anophagefferens]|nr:alpha-tubulin binding protein [Aureococcus anophagefferens]
MYYDNPGGRPQSAHMTRTGSRTGFGQRESIGNPLNLSLGRIRPMSASTSRTSFVPGASAKSDHSAPPPPMYAKEEPQVQSGYFVPASRREPEVLRVSRPILQYNSRSVPYHTNHPQVHHHLPPQGRHRGRRRAQGPQQRLHAGQAAQAIAVKHPDGRKFTPGDFVIGEEVTIFGRTFTIVDADLGTRRVYERTAKRSARRHARRRPPRSASEIKYKQAGQDVERPTSAPAMRSQRSATVAGHEVLRFFCAYQDDRRDGDRDRRYTMHCFCTDDTIEIKEVATEGVQRFPNLLRRSRLPKEAFWNPDNPLVDNNEPRQTLPPFNGYGAENDLYAMGLSLQPRVIKSTQQDYQRFIKADNKVLRFDGLEGGVFLSRGRYKKHPGPAVHRQEGAGSVLSRWLRPADFFDGNIVSFEAPATGRLLQTFRVVRADDYTKRVEEKKKLAAWSKHAIILEQLAEKLCAARIQVRSTFADRDAAKTRTLPEADFKKAVEDMEQQSLALTRGSRRAASSAATVASRALEKELVTALRLQIGEANAGNGLLRASFRAEDRDGHGTVDGDAWFRVLRKHKLHG